ncbi:MAG: NAD(P)H-binding protein [Bacteroidia bacterium]
MKHTSAISIIGAGWLGKDLGLHLQSEGHEVIGSRTSKEGINELMKEGLKGVVFDAGKDIPLPNDLKKDIVIITLPPSSAKEGSYSQVINKIINQINQNTSKIIFTSSTGVYSKEPGIYHELSDKALSERAKNILDAENVIAENFTEPCILRLGGLAGKDRHPGTRNSSPDLAANEPINMIYKDDVLSAISFILERNLSGIFNLVAPIHPNRGDYYNTIYRRLNIDKELNKLSNHPNKRTISSDKIQAEGFKFNYENPLDFPLE